MYKSTYFCVAWGRVHGKIVLLKLKWTENTHFLIEETQIQLPLISEEYVEDMENLLLSVNNIMKL